MGHITEDINKKFNIKRILLVVVICIAVICGVLVSFNLYGRPYDTSNSTYSEITISSDDNTVSIAEKLKEAGIIGKTDRFVTLSSLSFKNGKYKPGTYLLSPSMDFNQLSSTMINGISTGSGITIPSGYSFDQTISALEQAGIIKESDLDEVLNNVDFSNNFDFIEPNTDSKKQLEGFLYPDKYDIDAHSNASAMMVITTMLDNFDNNFTDEYRARAEELGLSIREVIIIASMIESITSIDKEKGLVSSVIHNRLNVGMPFKNGYPTDPICSPGSSSIKAALYPEETNYLYYIKSYKLDGSHEFAETADEYLDYQNKYYAAKQSEDDSESK